jgi:hypothetical protein
MYITESARMNKTKDRQTHIQGFLMLESILPSLCLTNRQQLSVLDQNYLQLF